MATEFSYEAVNAEGGLVTGTVAAASEREAALKLQGRGLTPLSVLGAGAGLGVGLNAGLHPGGSSLPTGEPKTARRAGALLKAPAKGKSVSDVLSGLPLFGVGPKDLIMFAENLAVLLGSGVSLDRALTILTDLAKGRFKAIVSDVNTRVREGSALAEALSRHSAFSPLFVGMVRAGERGGILETVLEQLALYLHRVQEIKEYLISAMIYPVILTLTSAASMAVLMIVVVPKFSSIFEEMGVALPAATEFLLAFGDFIRGWWWAILLVFALLAVGLWYAARSEKGRRVLDAMLLATPVLGPIFVKLEVARMAHTLGTLLGNGVSMLAALSMAREVVMNTLFRDHLGRVQEELKEGALLSACLAHMDRFPAQAVHMIGVGEESGELPKMLGKVAEVYDRDLRVAIKSFTALVEPVIILVMGLAIGAMVISMLMAIFSVNNVSF